MGHCHKRQKLEPTADIYSIANVIMTGRGTIVRPYIVSKAADMVAKIETPNYSHLSQDYYSALGDAVDSAAEADSDAHYESLHKPCELAEMCHKFLNCGQEVPAILKTGLIVRIKLPTSEHALPTLMD